MCLGLTAVGLDGDALARQAGIGATPGVGDFTTIPDETLYRLWRAAFEADPRPELPARVGMAVPFGAFGVTDYLAGTSQTLEAGLQALADRFALVSPVGRLEVSMGRVRLRHDGPSVFRFVSEPFTLGVIVGRFRPVLPAPLVEVRLAEPASGAADGFAEAFGAPTVLGAAHAEILFPTGSWTRPLGLADPSLHATLSALADYAEPQVPTGSETVLAVRHHLAEALPRATVSVPEAAAALGLSARTLQRRLAAEGTTFAVVLETVRRETADRLLGVGLSVQEVAERLGYTEPTSFTRAYRRWHGHPPSRHAPRRDRTGGAE
ncbi:MAG: AraC family transcriptional regulator ligand-binding domain-containing protein [Bacteroidota bacterium]